MTNDSNHMADKAPTPSTPDTDPQLQLKKRARRRLVGATALALLAVIILPMVMDQESRPPTQDIQIRIPSQDPASNAFSSRITSKQTAAKAETTSANSSSAVTATPISNTPAVPAPTPAIQPPVSASVPVAKTAPSPEDKLAGKPETPTHATEKPIEKPAEKPKADESARAASLLNDEHWVIQLGAYQEHGNIKVLQAKLKELGYRGYTEKIDTANGPRTRVRAGPFPNRAAAEKAQERLKKIGAGGPTGGTLAQVKQP